MKRHLQLLVALLIPTLVMSWCSTKPHQQSIPENSDPMAANSARGANNNLMCDTSSCFEDNLGYMPEPCVGMHVNYLGSDYGRVFNDSNYVHLQAAGKVGIKPLTDLRSHWTNTAGLTKIESCNDFYVESLTYSRPYLVSQAASMLHEIGRRFNDSLTARGGGAYRLKVTSVLRTPESVARLRRRNGNAVDSSVHSLGTTIDISHSSFICDNAAVPRSVNDLKGVLSEVLYAMRSEGKCLVKYERKQPCFHITVCNHPAYGKSIP